MTTKQMPLSGKSKPQGAEAQGSQHLYSTTKPPRRQAIADLLGHGSDNAIPRRDLEALSGWDGRSITRQIERERRAGTAILANESGYFLPADANEVDVYLTVLQGREREIARTRSAIAATRQQSAFTPEVNNHHE